MDSGTRFMLMIILLGLVLIGLIGFVFGWAS